MSAHDLEVQLRAAGHECTVQAMERLAIVIPVAGTAGLDDPVARKCALDLARGNGFTHLALELPEEEGARAPLPRD